MDKIAIIGTGMIGASMGLAIKQAGPKSATIVGSDRSRSNSNRAQKMGALDEAEGSVRRAVENAQVIILSTPVAAFREVMKEMASHLLPGCLVTDTGSTKTQVMKWAEEILPREVNFVGGHPMAGHEASGPEHANATLFQNKSYCIIPGARAQSGAVKTALELVNIVGARHHFMDPEEHDSYVAGVSHLPMLLSVALTRCTSRSPSWEDISKVASTGYKDITRLASGDPVMHQDICTTNGESIVTWIDIFMRELYEIRSQVMEAAEGDSAPIGGVFRDALFRRDQWLSGRVPTRDPEKAAAEDIPSFGDNMGQLFLGGKLMDAQKRLSEGLAWRASKEGKEALEAMDEQKDKKDKK